MELMNKSINDMLNTEWLQSFISVQEAYYEENVSFVAHVSAQHRSLIYELALSAMVSGLFESEDTVRFIHEARNKLYTLLAKTLDDVHLVEEEIVDILDNSHRVLRTNKSFKYIGQPNHHSWAVGETYAVIKVSSWTHNRDEIGYWMTTKDYDGDDADYGCFLPLGDLEKDFERI